jgi:hypothetical protein
MDYSREHTTGSIGMIGDAKAAGKSRKGPESFKQKNSKGQSFKTIAPSRDMKDDDGDAGTHKVARASTKGMRPGPGGRDRQNPKDQQAHKLVAHDQGSIIDQWCQGKRGSYK